MGLGQKLLFHAFGQPQGLLGTLGGRIMARGNRAMAGRAVALLKPAPGERILEIGFGPGLGIQLLAAASPSGCVEGVDPSPEMIAQAKARNADAIRRGQVTLHQAEAEDLPLAAGSFDAAMAINSLQAWSDAAAGLREIRRVLRRGGRLVLGFTRRSRQRPDGLPELIAGTGFVGVALVDRSAQGDFCVVASAP